MKSPTSLNHCLLICGLVSAIGIVCVTRQVHAADSVRPNSVRPDIVYILADEHADMGAQLTKLMAEQHHPSDIFPLRPFDQPALNNRAGKKP